MKIQLKTTREQPISGKIKKQFACNKLISFDIGKSFTNSISSNGQTLAKSTLNLLSPHYLILSYPHSSKIEYQKMITELNL